MIHNEIYIFLILVALFIMGLESIYTSIVREGLITTRQESGQ